jgi:hypothetical protein
MLADSPVFNIAVAPASLWLCGIVFVLDFYKMK